MHDIRNLTEAYVKAFNARDPQTVSALMDKNFVLTDPGVTGLSPKTAVMDYISDLFSTNLGLRFEAHRILVDGAACSIHFTLTLSETVLDGVDIVIWENGLMTEMYAYLTPRS